MAIFRSGDMWSVFDEVDYFVITTNAFVKTNGALVMGRGIAKQVRDKFPGVDKEMGDAVLRAGEEYGLLLGTKLGLFQVKHHYKDHASSRLITQSKNMLADHAETHPERTYALNFPGIGNGGLSYNVVKPLLRYIPDNVQIWTFT